MVSPTYGRLNGSSPIWTKMENLQQEDFKIDNNSDNNLNNQPDKDGVTKNDNSDGKSVVDALDKEIQRRKKELYELGDMLRKLKEENQGLVERIKSENIDVVIDEVSKKYRVTEEQKNQIIEKLKSSDVISKEKLLDLATSVYYSLNPNKIKELEEVSQKIASASEELKMTSVSSSSSVSSIEGSEFTPEELGIMEKFKIKPETMKKIKDGKIGFSLTENAQKIEF